MKNFIALICLPLIASLLAGCTAPAAQPPQAGKPLNVIATTTIVGDVINNLGGQAIHLETLLPTGADPHTFQPTPQDAAKLANADVIFANGAGLEVFMERLLQNSGSQARLVDLSAGISLLTSADEHAAEEHSADPEAHAEGDPHVWTDPNNVIVWVQNAEKALREMDPANASLYQANAEKYRQSLLELDAWIRQQVEQIPPANRKLVMDHQTFGYFARRYGFESVGAIIPGFSTQAEPSAQDLAALQDTLRRQGIRAIFVDAAANPTLAQRLAHDTGIQVVLVYSGSLSAPGEAAGTYIKFIQYNTNAILDALK